MRKKHVTQSVILITQWMLSSVGKQDLVRHIRHKCVIVTMFVAS